MSQITKSIKIGRFFQPPHLANIVHDLLQFVPKDVEDITIRIKTPFDIAALNSVLETTSGDYPIVFESLTEGEDQNLSGNVYLSFEIDDFELSEDDFGDFPNA